MLTSSTISGTKASLSSSFVNNSDEAVATHYREGSIDPKTKMPNRTGRRGEFVRAFNDPLPCLDNTVAVELHNTPSDDGTSNAAARTNNGTNCKEVEDVIQVLFQDQPNTTGLKIGQPNSSKQARNYLLERSLPSPDQAKAATRGTDKGELH
ncbi:hypothetical protein Ancab_038143, partial [Ancistrocladus abbreviatus]